MNPETVWITVFLLSCTRFRGALGLLESGGSQDIPATIAKLESEVSTLKSEVEGVRGELSELHSACDSCNAAVPAFMATMSGTVTGCDTGDPLIFESVKLNSQSSYDPRHGVFRAPRNGIYQFGVTLTTNPNEHLHVKLVKNSLDTEVGYLFINSGHDDYITVSTSVVVQLNAGDDIWCKCTAGTNSVVTGGLHSYFSGFFIGEN